MHQNNVHEMLLCEFYLFTHVGVTYFFNYLLFFINISDNKVKENVSLNVSNVSLFVQRFFLWRSIAKKMFLFILKMHK